MNKTVLVDLFIVLFFIQRKTLFIQTVEIPYLSYLFYFQFIGE